jgi:hypothetical protein
VAVRSPFSGDRFLALWLLLGAVQMIWVMQWVAARYYLTLLPPAVFLFLRALRTRRAHAPEAFGRVVARTAGVLFLLGGGLAVADWAQAETGRRIVDDLRRDAPVAPSGRKFILWDSFRAGDLLKEDGWQPAFPETVFVPGDLLLRPEVVMPPWWFGPGRPPLAVRAIHNYPWPIPGPGHGQPRGRRVLRLRLGPVAVHPQPFPAGALHAFRGPVEGKQLRIWYY